MWFVVRRHVVCVNVRWPGPYPTASIYVYYLRACSDTKLGRAQAVKLVGEDGYTILAAIDAITEKCTSPVSRGPLRHALSTMCVARAHDHVQAGVPAFVTRAPQRAEGVVSC